MHRRVRVDVGARKDGNTAAKKKGNTKMGEIE